MSLLINSCYSEGIARQADFRKHNAVERERILPIREALQGKVIDERTGEAFPPSRDTSRGKGSTLDDDRDTDR